jgi:hypothetical protein
MFHKRFFRDVQRMNVVYAMQWSILRPFAARSNRLGYEHRPHLLFETNFEGGWDEYIEGFARAVPGGMFALFGQTVGYPGLKNNANAFVEFVRRYDYAADFYYSAYQADLITILRSLRVYSVGAEQARADPETKLAEPLKIRNRWPIKSPKQFEVVVPIRSGRAESVRREVRDNEDRLFTALTYASRIHFARLLVLDFPSGSYLVMTATYDAGQRFRRGTSPGGRQRRRADRNLRVALAELAAAAARLPAETTRPGYVESDPIRAVLRGCVDYPAAIGDDARDVNAVIAYLLAHRHAPNRFGVLRYCAYPDRSVTQVRIAVDLPPARDHEVSA